MDANYKITRSSLHIEVTDRLREMIYERSLQPGERIDELALSARLGTSRTPLREALKVLAHEGLVRLVPGRGAFVIELSNAEIESLFPVLGLLQSRCAGEAVRHQEPEDIVALDDLLARIEQAVIDVRTADYYRAVDAFHERLQTMASNPWLTRSINDLGHFLQLVRTLMPLPENRLRQSMAEYRTLMKAIHRGDADAAEQLVYLQATAQQRTWRIHQAQAAAAEAGSKAEDAPAAAADTDAHTHGRSGATGRGARTTRTTRTSRSSEAAGSANEAGAEEAPDDEAATQARTSHTETPRKRDAHGSKTHDAAASAHSTTRSSGTGSAAGSLHQEPGAYASHRTETVSGHGVTQLEAESLDA